MRDIRFRAWNISGEQWEYFTLKELACMGVYSIPYDMPAICNWDNYKWWGQYTGPKDKLEIYEGDVVKKDGKIYVIRYSQHCFDLACSTNDWPKRQGGDIEIIGNIHKNPELLKGGDNG